MRPNKVFISKIANIGDLFFTQYDEIIFDNDHKRNKQI